RRGSSRPGPAAHSCVLFTSMPGIGRVLCAPSRAGRCTLDGRALADVTGERMKTVLVASSKGGVGKTTIATHLAAHAAIEGLETVLVDADPQGSSTRWAQRRSELDTAVLPIDGTGGKGWRRQLPGGTDQVVVDAAA